MAPIVLLFLVMVLLAVAPIIAVIHRVTSVERPPPIVLIHRVTSVERPVASDLRGFPRLLFLRLRSLLSHT